MQEDLEDLVQYLVGQTFGFRPRDLVALIAETLASFMPEFRYQFELDEEEHCDPRLIPVHAKEVEQVPNRVNLKSALTKTLKPLKKKVAASSVGTPEVTIDEYNQFYVA